MTSFDFSPSRRGGPVQPSHGALRPLGLDEVTIVDGFWHEKQRLNADVIIAHCEEWMRRIGWVANFERAASRSAGLPTGDHVGQHFIDSEIYKLLEAMAWELGRGDDLDLDLDRRYRALVETVAAAQDADGYLHTEYGRAGQPARYSDLEWGHEMYCFGHLIQAAVARLRSGHDDELPAIARRVADHLWNEFGPGGRVAVCGHPEIEPALAEFARATGDARYLELARLFVERRGTGTLGAIHFGAEYFQDDVPVRDATVLRGHAVRALYLAAGALDVAVETDDAALATAIETQWANTVARRTYVTGGMGSHHLDESFGVDFELPPDRSYAETCAGIASNMVSWRLLLQTGDNKYADLLERTLFNTVLASPREDGRAFYYTNTLHQRAEGSVPSETEVSTRAESSLRAPWFEVSCCPTNVARTLASIGLYFATASASGVQLHQYGDYDIATTVDGGDIALRVRSEYPFDGAVRVSVDAAPATGATLELRIPAWAAGATLDGEPVAAGGRAKREIVAGAELLLDLPMSTRTVRPHPSIDAIRGTVAFERGPLVLAVESVDLPGATDVADIRVTKKRAVSTSTGARVDIVRDSVPDPEWPYGFEAVDDASAVTSVDLIPYFTWANRGPSTMRVWIPTAETL